MTEPLNPPDSQSVEAEDEISLFDVLIVLAKYNRVILGLPFVAAVIAAGYSLSLPNSYTANTKLLPPQSQSAASAMLAQLGGIAGLVGGAAKSPNDIYIALLKSRTLADNMIQRFELMKLWGIDIKHPSDVYNALAKITKITSEKDGIITIEVDDQDPKRAADFANAYAEELLKLTSTIALTEASKSRLFFERQLALAKDNLVKAEAAARQALQTSGLVKVDDQGRAIVEATVRLRGQITVKEVQIGAMRTFAADRNPELQFAQRELESLKHELARIEGAAGTKSATSGPSGQGSDSLRLLREVKYHEVIFELLAKQYELAKIDEAKDSAVIRVLDKAIVPDRKSGPKRTLIVLLYASVAGFIALVWAFMREAFEVQRAKRDPQQTERVARMKSYLRLGRRARIT